MIIKIKFEKLSRYFDLLFNIINSLVLSEVIKLLKKYKNLMFSINNKLYKDFSNNKIHFQLITFMFT